MYMWRIKYCIRGFQYITKIILFPPLQLLPHTTHCSCMRRHKQVIPAWLVKTAAHEWLTPQINSHKNSVKCRALSIETWAPTQKLISSSSQNKRICVLLNYYDLYIFINRISIVRGYHAIMFKNAIHMYLYLYTCTLAGTCTWYIGTCVQVMNMHYVYMLL